MRGQKGAVIQNLQDFPDSFRVLGNPGGFPQDEPNMGLRTQWNQDPNSRPATRELVFGQGVGEGLL